MPGLTLLNLAPNSPFRLAGIPVRTGILRQAGISSARVEWHTIYQVVVKNGKYKAIVKSQGGMMIVAPSTAIQHIEDPVNNWGEVPMIKNSPALRSGPDIDRLGWEIDGVAIRTTRPTIERGSPERRGAALEK